MKARPERRKLFPRYASPQRRWNNCGPVIHGVGSSDGETATGHKTKPAANTCQNYACFVGLNEVKPNLRASTRQLREIVLN
jgi:hypothetical protein